MSWNHSANSLFSTTLGDANPSIPQSNKVVMLTPYERMGVTAMAVAGVLSCVLVSTLLLYIAFSALSSWSRKTEDRSTLFTSKQIAVFITCLLVSDLIQSISGITQVKWAIKNRIYDSPSCSVQAATLVMGDLGSTVWSCVIAAHTFSGIALGKSWPRWAVWTTVISGWAFVIVLTAIGPLTLAKESKGPFFSIAGTWCFISSEYAVPRLVIHYVPLFTAAAIILVIYGLIFLLLRGNISFFWPRIGATPLGANDVRSRQRVAIAKRMLWYPVAYLTCIMPIAITRLVGLQEENVPEGVWILGMFFLFSLGAVDSIIYATTRKVIKPIKLPSFHVVALRPSFSNTRMSEESPSAKLRKNDLSPWIIADISTEAFTDGNIQRDLMDKDELDLGDTRRGGVRVTTERIEEVM